ncbi:MAG: DUF4258 domain-containing protein, partial [Opitutales bacterium]
ISNHALAEMLRREIPQAVLEAVLETPEQIVPEISGVVCYQSRVTMNQKPYLLRVIVNETRQPPLVVTVYRTSKIAKYWEKP